ncbi:MAG TPA: UDP-2,3-diacylglucosamine diphosphatase LpxI [Candidatus Acidoferrales bacterium]|nr:UDP-2,3-diacylglucosamine diphosphatase LpxI [Candidatus Acidoferrales bacterium]
MGETIKKQGWGLIAGNGDFPLLVLEGARRRGIEMAVVAIREEATPELDRRSARVHWVGLGELGRAIDLLHQERVTRAVMAGQVKHRQIYSDIPPDHRMATLLERLGTRNTDALIGAVARILEHEGIELVDSTMFLEPLVPRAGALTARQPTEREAADVAYGRSIARRIAELDLGQTVVIAECACLAIEAMEGTDQTIERAAKLAAGRPLAVVKVSKPQQDMRFDVPVVGPGTIEVMQRSHATVLAIDAGRTLVLDRERVVEMADATGIAIEAQSLPDAPASQGATKL